jgi:hypothetical protein
VFEVIAGLDPIQQRDEWGDLRARDGDRITTTAIDDASHALFPRSLMPLPPRLSTTCAP